MGDKMKDCKATTLTNCTDCVTYALVYEDGNTGSVEVFETYKKAEDFADRLWYRLSKGDRKKYCDKSKGARFEIVTFLDETNESWFTLKDYTEEVK